MASLIKYNNACRGFTVIEMLVVVAIIALLLAAAGDLTRTFQTQNDIQTTGVLYAQALRRAQELSQSGSGDSGWGVSIATGSIVLFEGSTYATRNTNFDEPYPFSSSVSVVGLSEVDFAKFTGLPNASGTTTLSQSGATASKSISINAKGTITY